MFIAVRGRALQRLEDAVGEVEARGGDVLAHVQELTAAEQDAVHALGFEWRSYTRVREEIERLASAQRRRDDQRLLSAELGRARDDLAAQLELAKDPPSRQFLEAQRRSIVTQLERLEHDRELAPAQAEELRLLELARAEVATLQGRQERLQRRVQELLRRAAASLTPGVNPGATAVVAK
jgi:chromosome segregation ATPase